MTKKIICITGMDGTGKSTLIEGLRNYFPSCHVSTIWDLMTNPVKGLPFKSKQEIDHFLCELTPDSRLLFLAHAMKYSIDKALTSNKEIILIDSYYYKYFASEIVLGASEKLSEALQQNFPEPDLTIELLLSIEESAKRKKGYSRYECGLSDEPGEKSFLKFRKKVMKIWPRFQSDKWFTIDSELPVKRVLEETLNQIL